MKHLGNAALWALMLAATSSALAADTARCGSKVVSVGMTQAEILEHCGTPTSREVEEQPVRAGHVVTGTTTLERWTYDAGVFLFVDRDRTGEYALLRTNVPGY